MQSFILNPCIYFKLCCLWSVWVYLTRSVVNWRSSNFPQVPWSFFHDFWKGSTC